jgi:D-alanyl-D-alanine carboxypeptidase/D-alanyl-D-alanine-endopeptidase (penicillin-binding protein 4)
MRKARLVRAKTGTLSDIVALSGYVLSPSGGAPVAFAFVVNNVSGKVTGARAAVDKCVQAVVRAHTRAKAGADEPD